MPFINPQANLFLADIMRPEQNSFGVIRVAIAVAVLVSHSFYFVAGTSTAEPLGSWTGHSLGEHAVQVFFFLSGILVTESLLRSRSMIDFVTGRLLRIFPGLIVCIVLTALVLGPLVTIKTVGAYFGDVSVLSYILKTASLATGAAPLPGVFEQLSAAGSVNLSLWTLKYEVLCYAGLTVLGAMGLLNGTARRPTTVVFALVVFTIFLRSPSGDVSYTQADNLRYFALYFGMGTLVVLLKEHVVISTKATAAFLALYIATRGTPWAELSCALFVGSLTLLAATWNFGPLRDWTNTRDLSFGIYIYAAPLQQALLQFDPGLNPLGLACVALVPATMLAGASWTWIEKPALGLRRRSTKALTAGAIKALQLLKLQRVLHKVPLHHSSDMR
jgi:peptidoglycan/LPS O-acetylase OafA/YrhL